MADVSATAEPETPEMSMLATTVTYPSPPRTWPHMALATMMMRSEMPPVFMISPASRKNGIAMSGKLSMPRKMLWMMRAGDQAPRVSDRTSAVRKSAKAIGTVSRMKPNRAVRKSGRTLMAAPPSAPGCRHAS